MTRKLHDDLRLSEMMSNTDPDDTLILIIGRVDRNTGERTTELGASTPGVPNRRDLLDVISDAYLNLVRVRVVDANGNPR